MRKIRIMVKPGANTRRVRKSKVKLSPQVHRSITDVEKNEEILERLKRIEEKIKHPITKEIIKPTKEIVKEIVHEHPKAEVVDERIINELERLQNARTPEEKIIVVNEQRDHGEQSGHAQSNDNEINLDAGIEIPATDDVVKEEAEELTEAERQNIEMKYSLVPKKAPLDKALAYAHIHWDERRGNLIYDVVEPKLDDAGRKQIVVIKEYIEDKINVIFDEINKKEAIAYLEKKVDEAFDYFNIKDEKRKRVLKYYIFRDFLGLEKIDALMKDPNIEDISCDGVGIPIFVYHKDNRIGSIATNVIFNSKDELDEFVMKLAEKCKKSISILRPLLDSSLPDGSRVQATLGSDIAHKGSNFTIRKFPEMPLTPTDMLLNGTMDLNIATYLWFLIENSSSVLISGGTATGKTSLLNAISLFIPKEAKIVSIEDTAEIRLIHPNWIPEVARSSTFGGVTMFDLLRESLRQRPDYIIVGEVRGKEAYVLFQQMATGHPGISTIHAEDFNKLMDRLTTPPINLSPSLIESLNIIVFLKRMKYKNRYIRRVNEVVEILGFDRKSNQPITRRIFHWDADHDKFIVDNKSYMLEKVRSVHGFVEEELKEEFKNRTKLLKWIALRKINDYRIFTRVIDLYKMKKDEVLMRIEAEL